MSSIPPKELHWLNLRAAIPSNKSAAKEYTYDASANNHWSGTNIIKKKLKRLARTLEYPIRLGMYKSTSLLVQGFDDDDGDMVILVRLLHVVGAFKRAGYL
mmetsp:Transcript_15998/g.23858  ORF Transcript_15998/g.23858 Transcript_15998/m.23858 type:complete len:101 (-) Transcript_15998:37-339(-)